MTYVLAGCELDTRIYTLRRSGRVCPLRPKVFQVLLYLLDHSDRVVSKQELIEHAWPGQFISGATLEGCVKQVRQALGDSWRAQCLLQTLHGHGYRIIVPVERLPDTAPGLEAASGLVPRPEAASDDAASTLLDVAASLPEPLIPLVPPPAQEMRHCMMCQHVNSIPAVFCVACGTRLMQSCAYCGQQVKFPAGFCSGCGQPLAGLDGSETTPSSGHQSLDHTGCRSTKASMECR
jgi:DNA-binding winged helix-turn-helix (wHTH) protein